MTYEEIKALLEGMLIGLPMILGFIYYLKKKYDVHE